MQDVSIYGASAVAITLAITQIVKQWVDSKWSPVVSILIGVGLVALGSWGFFNGETIVKGIIIGLLSSGLYSGTKSVIGK